MMVLATNRPGDLDAAVNDRVDEALSFDLPGLAERESMCWLYFSKVASFVAPLRIFIANSCCSPVHYSQEYQIPQCLRRLYCEDRS
jgi:AAA+ superfamily predicted ATPase